MSTNSDLFAPAHIGDDIPVTNQTTPSTTLFSKQRFSKKASQRYRHTDDNENIVPTGVVMKHGIAFKGIMVNVVSGNDVWTQNSLIFCLMVNFAFAILALAESVQRHYLDPMDFTIAYVVCISVADIAIFFLVTMYMFNLQKDLKNKKSKSTWRHNIDVGYVIPAVIIQTFFAIWALAAWVRHFGEFVSPTSPSGLAYAAYMRWDFAMMILIFGGLIVAHTCLKALHALKNMEIIPLSYDTTKSGLYVNEEGYYENDNDENSEI